jgi:hypothetical protein
MASPTVYDTIKAFLQMQFAPIPVIDYDQIDAALEQGTNPFLVIQEIFETETAVAVGDPSGICLREEADLLVECFVPAPESSDVARRQVEAVKNALRFRTLSGVRITEVSPPEAAEMNDGLWTRYGCTVSAEWDTHVPLP